MALLMPSSKLHYRADTDMALLVLGCEMSKSPFVKEMAVKLLPAFSCWVKSRLYFADILFISVQGLFGRKSA